MYLSRIVCNYMYPRPPAKLKPCRLTNSINYKTVTYLKCQKHKPHSHAFLNYEIVKSLHYQRNKLHSHSFLSNKLMPGSDYSTIDLHVTELSQHHDMSHGHAYHDDKQTRRNYQET